MSNATANRRINLYINGKEVKNDIASIKKEMYKLINEQSRMTLGSDEYVKHARKIRTLKGMISEHNKSLRTTEGSWKRLTRSVRNSWQTVVGFGVAIGGAIATVWKFIDAANQFEKSLSSLSSITGLAGDELKWLGDQAKQLSVSTTEDGIKITKSATDILEAYKLMGSAKPELLKNKEALHEVTKEALILAEAAEMDTATAVESLANTMNQFNAPASEARKYINALAAGSKAGAAAIPDVAAAVKNFGAVAATANLSIEESVGLIETLAEKGIKGAESGVKLRNFLLTLQTGADDTNPAVVGLNTALDNFAEKGYTTTELTKMFGKENVLVAQILSESTEKVNEYTKAVTDTNVAYEQAQVNTSNTAAALAQAKNEFQLMSITLGEKLQPVLLFSISKMSDLIKVIMDLVDWTSEHQRGLKFLAKVLAVVAAALLSNKVAYIASNIALKAYNSAVKLATTVTRGFNTVLKANPLGIVLSLLSAAATYLWLFTDETKDATAEQEDFSAAIRDGNTELEERDTILQKITKGLGETSLSELKAALASTKKELDDLSETSMTAQRTFDSLFNSDGNIKANVSTEWTRSGAVEETRKKLLDEIARLEKAVKEKERELHQGEETEEEKKKKKEIEDARKKLQDSLKRIREDMLLDGMSADEKELAQLKSKYDELRELAIQGNKDVAEVDKLYAEEKEKLEADQEKRRLAAKQAAQEKLEEFYMSDFDKEKKAKIKQYQELIALAKKFELVNTEYYKRLIKDLEKIKNSKDGGEVTDILGMSPEQWEQFQQNLDITLQHFDQLASAYNAWADLRDAESAKELQKEEEKADRKKEILDDQLARGVLSEEEYNKKVEAIDEELQRKQAEEAVAKAQRDKIASLFSIASDTARAIMASVAASPLTLGMPWTAIIGGIGALQSAAVLAQPLPEYATGGYTDGDRVYRAGEAGEEWIAPYSMLQDPLTGPVISNLENIRKGLAPKTSATTIPDFSAAQSVTRASIPATSYSSDPQSYPAGQSSDNSAQILIEETKGLRDEVKKLTEFLSDPDNRRAYISYDLLKKYEKEVQNLQELGRIS
jgi:TP901 family phage tail tape measure protein